MKNLLLNNWRAKLISLLIAFVIWIVIRRNVDVGFQKREGFPQSHERIELKK